LKIGSGDSHDSASVLSIDTDGDLTSEFVSEMSLKSWLYDWNKKLFMQPDLGYDPFEDPLSIEGSIKLLKKSRQTEIFETKKRLHYVYKDFDKIPDDFDPSSENGYFYYFLKYI
jgi:hypothetical protein